MLYLTQLIYVHPGKESQFHGFEDIVLPLLPKYDGELLLRVRPTSESIVGGSMDVPYEIHFLKFPSPEAVVRFSEDEARQRHLHLKNDAVRASLLVTGTTT
jgi:hypothetical protein